MIKEIIMSIRELENKEVYFDGISQLSVKELEEIYENKKENKQMDSRVTTFLVALMSGKETEEAIKVSGVGELTTNEILTEIASIWNKDTLKAIINFQNWFDTSYKLLSAIQNLKKSNNSIRELDDALVNLKSNRK